MAKKVLLILALVSVLAGGIWAQEQQEKSANVRSNWISGELSILGGGVRYERMLGPKISVGVNLYYSTLFFFWNELEAGLVGRLYPWGKTFFVEAGVGYHVHSAIATDSGTGLDFEATTGVAISPGLGWKIDVGNPGGFFTTFGVKVPITLGNTDYAFKEDEFGVGVGFVPYFALGAAF